MVRRRQIEACFWKTRSHHRARPSCCAATNTPRLSQPGATIINLRTTQHDRITWCRQFDARRAVRGAVVSNGGECASFQSCPMAKGFKEHVIRKAIRRCIESWPPDTSARVLRGWEEDSVPQSIKRSAPGARYLRVHLVGHDADETGPRTEPMAVVAEAGLPGPRCADPRVRL